MASVCFPRNAMVVLEWVYGRLLPSSGGCVVGWEGMGTWSFILKGGRMSDQCRHTQDECITRLWLDYTTCNSGPVPEASHIWSKAAYLEAKKEAMETLRGLNVRQVLRRFNWMVGWKQISWEQWLGWTEEVTNYHSDFEFCASLSLSSLKGISSDCSGIWYKDLN